MLLLELVAFHGKPSELDAALFAVDGRELLSVVADSSLLLRIVLGLPLDPVEVLLEAAASSRSRSRCDSDTDMDLDSEAILLAWFAPNSTVGV